MPEYINNTRRVNVHSDKISEPLSSYFLSEHYFSNIVHWQIVGILDPVNIYFWTCILLVKVLGLPMTFINLASNCIWIELYILWNHYLLFNVVLNIIIYPSVY